MSNVFQFYSQILAKLLVIVLQCHTKPSIKERERDRDREQK